MAVLSGLQLVAVTAASFDCPGEAPLPLAFQQVQGKEVHQKCSAVPVPPVGRQQCLCGWGCCQLQPALPLAALQRAPPLPPEAALRQLQRQAAWQQCSPAQLLGLAEWVLEQQHCLQAFLVRQGSQVQQLPVKPQQQCSQSAGAHQTARAGQLLAEKQQQCPAAAVRLLRAQQQRWHLEAPLQEQQSLQASPAQPEPQAGQRVWGQQLVQETPQPAAGQDALSCPYQPRRRQLLQELPAPALPQPDPGQDARTGSHGPPGCQQPALQRGARSAGAHRRAPV